MDNNISKILEITYTWLVAANIYYDLFDKLINSFFQLDNSKALIVKDTLFEKVVKKPAPLSLANGFYSQALFLIIANQAPLSSLVDNPT